MGATELRAQGRRAILASWGIIAGAIMTASACDSGGEDIGFGGAGGGQPPPPAVCQAGLSCPCDKGALGRTVCGGGEKSCDCVSCPGVKPTVATAFDSCGGEPFGRWGTTAITWDDFKLAINLTSGSSQSVLYCGGVLTKLAPNALVLMELRDGGKLTLASTNFKYSFDVRGGCVPVKCEQLKLPMGTCKSDGCGVCSCEAGHLGLGGEGTWSRKDGSMEWTLPAGKLALSYCVQGDQMKIRDGAGLDLTLERVSVGGKPLACAQREAETCVARGDCKLGACLGAAKCASALTAPTCTATSGCSWDPQACAGTALAACTLHDYGITPGCEVTSGQRTCTGVATSCQGIGKVACTSNPGCIAKAGCVGGETSCRAFDGACSFCDSRKGCACDGKGLCQGTTQCGGLGSSLNCQNAQSCSWTECSGEAVACEDLADTECASVPGCKLVGP